MIDVVSSLSNPKCQAVVWEWILENFMEQDCCFVLSQRRKYWKQDWNRVEKKKKDYVWLETNPIPIKNPFRFVQNTTTYSMKGKLSHDLLG